MPSLPASKVKDLSTVVYPPPGSSPQLPYTNQIQRTKLAIAEGLINCLATGVHNAYNNQTRGYQFSVFPGMHAQDVGYTFWNGETQDSLGVPILRENAERIQRWIVEFTRGGFDALDALGGDEGLPVYGSGAQVVNVTTEGTPEVVRDPADNGRCRFWLEGLTA